MLAVSPSLAAFAWFNGFVVVMLALDLGLFHRKNHEVRVREALVLSGCWIGLALLFALGIRSWLGPKAALEFLTGYLIEKALSVDNLFVFILLFTYFRVPARLQYKVLFWGIIGALLMRAAFIAAGVALIHRFHAIIYVFGGFLIYSGVRLSVAKAKEVHPEKNVALRLLRRVLPITEGYDEGKFIVRKDGRWWATPLLVVLIAVETTDILFAVDSIPAVLSVTTDPFLVYTSNVFAILGLRALYFALAGLMKLFNLLHYGLSAILAFVGLRMVLTDIAAIPVEWALLVVAGILALCAGLSLLLPSRHAVPSEPAAPST